LGTNPKKGRSRKRNPYLGDLLLQRKHGRSCARPFPMASNLNAINGKAEAEETKDEVE
jgi:hypothetical protein